jgi:hypothetical protein
MKTLRRKTCCVPVHPPRASAELRPRSSALNPKPAGIDIAGEEIGRCALRRLSHRLQRPSDAAIRIQVAPSLTLPPTTG